MLVGRLCKHMGRRYIHHKIGNTAATLCSRAAAMFYNLLIYLVLNKTHSVSFHPDHLFFSSMNFMNDKVLLQNNKIFKFCASHIICFSWCYSTHLEEELQISDEFIVVFNKLTLR